MESTDELGITHLLEHLLFKRTKRLNARQIAEKMDELGGDINATTDVETLSVHGSVPSADLAELVDFFAEMILDTDFSEDDMEAEREVVRQEILEVEDNPAELTYLGFSDTIWPGSNLGKAVFGSLETLDAVTTEQLWRRRTELLHGNRIVVAAAGNVDTDALVRQIERLFSHLPESPAVELPTPDTAAGFGFLARPISQAYLSIGISWPGVASEQYLPGYLLVNVLGAGSSSRLFQRLREEHALAYDVGASIDSYPDISAMIISAVVERKSLNQALDLISGELDLIRTRGIEDAEVNRCMSALARQTEMGADSVSGRLGRLLETELTYGRYVSAEEIVTRIRAITKSDVESFAAKYLPKHGYVVFLGGDVEGFRLTEKGAALTASQ